jgi:hypothetical protein
LLPVDFLSDATGTLSIKNDLGEVSYEELHKTILLVQGARFSNVESLLIGSKIYIPELYLIGVSGIGSSPTA